MSSFLKVHWSLGRRSVLVELGFVIIKTLYHSVDIYQNLYSIMACDCEILALLEPKKLLLWTVSDLLLGRGSFGGVG